MVASWRPTWRHTGGVLATFFAGFRRGMLGEDGGGCVWVCLIVSDPLGLLYLLTFVCRALLSSLSSHSLFSLSIYTADIFIYLSGPLLSLSWLFFVEML